MAAVYLICYLTCLELQVTTLLLGDIWRNGVVLARADPPSYRSLSLSHVRVRSSRTETTEGQGRKEESNECSDATTAQKEFKMGRRSLNSTVVARFPLVLRDPKLWLCCEVAMSVSDC